MESRFSEHRFLVYWNDVLHHRRRVNELDDFFHHGISPDRVISIWKSSTYHSTRRTSTSSLTGKYTLLTAVCGVFRHMSPLHPAAGHGQSSDQSSDQSSGDRKECALVRQDMLQEELVTYLLEQNANPNQADPYGRYPLQMAIEHGNGNVVLALLRHGSTMTESQLIEMLDKFTESSYLVEDLMPILDVLLVQGVLQPFLNLPLVDNGGYTVHHFLMQMSVRTDIRPILQRLARVDPTPEWKLVDKYGNSPLHVVFEESDYTSSIELPDVTLIQYVLDQEPELVDMENNDGETAFSMCQRKIEDVVSVKVRDRWHEMVREMKNNDFSEEEIAEREESDEFHAELGDVEEHVLREGSILLCLLRPTNER